MHEVDRRDRSKMFSDESSDKHLGFTIPLSRIVKVDENRLFLPTSRELNKFLK